MKRILCSAALLLALAGCTSRSPHIAPQIAVLRFENLSSDPSLDWMGRGFSEILSGSLEGSQELYAIQWRALHGLDRTLGSRPAAAPGISTEQTGAIAAGANTIVYGDFAVTNGVLRATATEEDVATHKVLRVVSASQPAAEGIFPVALALARQLGPAHAYPTRNQQALQAYVSALESTDPAAAVAGMSQAASLDPGFGTAYIYWVDAAIAQRNRAEAERALAAAHTDIERFSPMDRARLELGAANLSGDFEKRLRALSDLARADPTDPNNHRALAEALMDTRAYEDAIVEFRRALTLRPDDVQSLNLMGYAAAFSGDLPTAIRVLRGYEQLRPNEPNPLDSLGDAHFALGHFAEAEQFYEAARAKSPGFLNGGELIKAAQAHLMTGDVPGATAIFERFLAERRKSGDAFAEYHAAAWAWQTGSRRAALEILGRMGKSPRADIQAAIWLLELGDRPAALEHARNAAAQAGPEDAPAAALALFLAQPGADVPGAVPETLRDYARIYVLLFARDFQPAMPLLEKIYRRPTTELDDGLAILLAWTYEQTGQWQKAEPLLRLNPLPQASGPPLFSSLFFPRLFQLRGAFLAHAGQHAEAEHNFQLFKKLSGGTEP